MGRAGPVNRLAVHLRQKNMRDGLEHWSRSAFEQIRDTHEKPAIPEPDGIVEVGKAKELDSELRHGGPRPQLAVSLLKNLCDPVAHFS
jgi:hypothetical protein